MAKKQRTQEDDLKAILKSLGYNSVEDMPPRSILQDKAVQGTLSLREAVVLDLYARGLRIAPGVATTEIGKQFLSAFPASSAIVDEKQVPAPESAKTRVSAVVNSATKAGFQLNTPFRDIVNKREALEKISQVSSTAIDPYWSGVQKSATGIALITDGDAPLQYQDPKRIGVGLAGSKQGRESKKFDGVPPLKDAFPEVVRGLSEISDNGTKNALIASSLAPYRPGEIANLRIGKYDPNIVTTARAPGYFDPVEGVIIFPEGSQTTTKSTLERFKLDKNSILYNVLMEQAKEAEALGSNYLFPNVTTKSMTNAIREHITPRLAQFEEILGRPFDESKDFRKLVASMVVGELGFPEEAEKMMGHSTPGQLNDALTNISKKFYVSSIVRVESPLTAVELALENMIGEALGANTLNETAVGYGLSINGFTDIDPEDPRVIPITREGQELSDTLTVEKRPLTDAELASLESRAERVSGENYEAGQQAIQRGQILEQENLEREKTLQTTREEVAQKKQQDKDALAIAKEEERKAALKMDEEQSKGFLKAWERITGNKYTKLIVTGVPLAGITYSASSRLEAAEARVAAGEGEMPAYLKEGARFIVEEFTPLGIPIAAAEFGAEMYESTKKTLEEDVAKRSQITDVEDFGTEMQMRNLFEQKRNIQ